MNKNINTILIIIGSFILIGFASMVYSNYTAKESQSTVLPEQKQEVTTANDESKKETAPDFELKDINGKVIKLSDYKGKIVVLNFWAVWCKYCKQEMPDLNELNQTLSKDNNVVIITVDVQESKDIVKEYLDKNKISLNVLMDEEGTVAQIYGVSGFPTTFIINKDREIVGSIPRLTTKAEILGEISKISGKVD